MTTRMRTTKFSGQAAMLVIALLLLAATAWGVEPGMVNTVLGPIPADKVGFALPHEHFYTGYNGWHAHESTAPVNKDELWAKDLRMIADAKAAGVTTIVDAGPADSSRFPELLAKLSKETGMNIIISTGLYAEHGGATDYWKKYIGGYLGRDMAKDMADLFTADIEKGIGTTGVKAGNIKIGIDGDHMTDYEKAVHKAAVAAQKATGVPIITHSNDGKGVLEQANFLLSEGGNPKRIMIGHLSDDGNTVEIDELIAKKGFYLGFDRIGISFRSSLDDLAKTVAELIKRGYGKQILLSHDYVAYFLGQQGPLAGKFAKGMEDYQIDTIPKMFIPKLKALGVTDEQIQDLTVGNPKNFYASAK